MADVETLDAAAEVVDVGGQDVDDVAVAGVAAPAGGEDAAYDAGVAAVAVGGGEPGLYNVAYPVHAFASHGWPPFSRRSSAMRVR